MSSKPDSAANPEAASPWHERPLRRVVTGAREDGRSCVASDGAPGTTLSVAGMLRLTQIWRTDVAPRVVPLAADAREAAGPPSVGHLGSEQTLFVIMDLAPGDIAKSSRLEELLATDGMVEAQSRTAGSAHPGMHATDTIDYSIVVEGEITLVLDEEQVVLRAGDLLVQGGVSHTWINHTDRPVRMLGVLVGARRA
ncbi:MAG: cupin domain-containing protein [Gammaproteobacteria bacterium]|nr:cupin domain-containing protein [Gammaproteobacteria bacterium]